MHSQKLGPGGVATLLLSGCLLVAEGSGAPHLDPGQFRRYVETFNQEDHSNVRSAIPNASAWEWMKANIPLFDASDADLVRTYYFRWWAYRKHIKQTPDGWVLTEFLPEVPWAGKYNTISCAAGHHIYEGRWLRNPVYLDDYCKFWFRDGAEPRRYSFWAADAMYARYLVTANRAFTVGLLPGLIANYKGWEDSHLSRNGLFWQIDDRDGMEKSIGGSGFRPTINSYMYGDAKAIAAIAQLEGNETDRAAYDERASSLRSLVNTRLWNSKDQFYETLSRDTDAFSGVRELIGYVPWYFNLPASPQNVAWRQLFDIKGFAAHFGPTTAERRSPRFMFEDPHECLWNGPSWPFATTQTLVAMANLLNNYERTEITKEDYFRLLQTYTTSQRRTLPDRRTIAWIDEDLNPDTGAWIARDTLHRLNRSDQDRGEYYNHSGYADLIISGLVGLRPRGDDRVEVNPLVPAGRVTYFCLDKVRYHNRDLTIIYDETGDHYHAGAGLHVFADGREIGSALRISHLLLSVPD